MNTAYQRRWLRQYGSSLLLAGAGVLLVLATFEFPISSTLVGCGADTTTWSPVSGLSLPVVNFRGFGFSDLAFYWSDGCNTMASSLVPVFAAVACFVGAVRRRK